MKKTLLVYNILTSSISKKTVEKTIKILGKHNIHADTIKTSEVGEARDKILNKLGKGRVDFVTVLGGDGIINEAVNALAYKDIPLGIIPHGTTNAFAREKGIPLSVKKAVRVFREENLRTIDLGLINDEKYFLMMCSYGFDVKALSEINLMLKKKLKVLAYIFYGVRAFLLHRPVKVVASLDNVEKYEGYFCIINNVKSYGNPLAKITPHASTEDGFLDVCIFKNSNKFSFLKNVIGVFTTRHINFEDVVYFQTNNKLRIEIKEGNSRKENLQVQLDGDVLSNLPIEVRPAKSALKIFLPKG